MNTEIKIYEDSLFKADDNGIILFKGNPLFPLLLLGNYNRGLPELSEELLMVLTAKQLRNFQIYLNSLIIFLIENLNQDLDLNFQNDIIHFLDHKRKARIAFLEGDRSELDYEELM
jgi:hypothetical protein